MEPGLRYLLPYEFSATVLVLTVGAAILFARGLRARRRAGRAPAPGRAAAFFLGLGLVYVMLQTHVDYLAQHMFWVHRAQHLVLHHLAPLLLVLAVPHEVMGQGLPDKLRDGWLRPLWRHPLVRIPYRLVQGPLIAGGLFVGLVALVLYPPVHFAAMLDVTLYKALNWAMVADGLLFWWLILDPRSPAGGARLGFGIRLLLLWAIMLPQIAMGAALALNDSVVYAVYQVCGRAWPISPLLDQQLGGLLTWIPAAMMSVVAALLVLRLWLRHSEAGAGARGAPEPAEGEA